MRGGSGAPGASSGSINIRGISSLSLSTEPLVIVDGAPYSASLSNIPQSDIESVTVLKDAASAALYGARGASGVILITTKTGKTRNHKLMWMSNGVQTAVLYKIMKPSTTLANITKLCIANITTITSIVKAKMLLQPI